MIDGISVLIGIVVGFLLCHVSLKLGLRVSFKAGGGEGDPFAKEKQPDGLFPDQEEIIVDE